MEGKDHARIHTGRNDCNGRPRGSRRRTTLGVASLQLALQETAENYEIPDDFAAALTAAYERWSEAEAGDQSLDGVHSDETPQA
jgi:hypothetical protein